MIYSKEIVREWLDEVAERAKDHPEWVDVFERCYTDTLDNTVEILEDGSTFVLTGDIPAMWLRDSTAQLRPYLQVAKRDALLRQTIAGLVKRQMTLVLKDPYANSFNIEENWKGHHETDHTDLNGWIWERKYEVDSLCYPLQLAYLLWKETGETSQFDETFVAATKEILHLWTVEQDHKNSPYRFVRDTDRKEDTLINDGFGPDFAVTGMTWSAFRPSDDCCQYSYLIPSNMFAVVVLGYVQEIFAELDLADSESVIADAKRLQDEIQEGIENYAYTSNSKGEKIYACHCKVRAKSIIYQGVFLAVRIPNKTIRRVLVVLFHCPQMKNFLGRCDKSLIKLTSLASLFPEEISQLQRIAKRVHLILAFPNPAIKIGMICLVVTLPVLLNVEGVGIRILEHQGHLTFNQTCNGLAQEGISFSHLQVGSELGCRISKPHSRNISCEHKG